MEPIQASARPSRTPARSTDDAAAAATQAAIKKEDEFDDDRNVFRSRPRLQEPVRLLRSLAELMKMMQAGTIDVDPEYQREVVWTADRMTGLIDSLMENFYIPPIILNKKSRSRPEQNDSGPQDVYVCVDGKQRLSSVLAFIRGMIPCHDHRGEKWWFCEPEGSKRKRTLSEKQQKEFYMKDFVAFEYNDLSPEQEEDLFARVQMGVQLNLAEKMRASTGPWQELARLFVADFDEVYSLMKDRARSKDFQLTLSCFSQIVECMHPTAANGVPILKTNYTHLPKLLSNKGAVDDALKSHLAGVWNTFKDLIDTDPDTFTNAKKYLRGVQTFAPVEMVAVTVLISMHSETRNNRLLIGDIQAMRIAVRETFVDLRLNATVWRWFWEYIDELEAIRGAINGSTVDRNTHQRTKKNNTAPSGGLVAGPTVTAITAAASAPKKGRFTARTKRTAEAANGQSIVNETGVAVKQEPTAAQLPGLPSPKRRRTEQGIPSALGDEGDRLWAPMYNAPWQYVEPPNTRISPDLSLPPMPTHESIRVPSRKPLQGPHASSGSQKLALPRPIPPTPLEVRQQRVSALHSYRSSLESSSQNGVSDHCDQQFGKPPQAAVAPMLDGPGLLSSTHSIWRSECSPDVLGNLGDSQVPISSRPNVVDRSTMRARQATHSNDEELIDLTSDTEQERAILLSAFRPRPNPSGPSKKAANKVAAPSVQVRNFATKEQNLSSQELPNRGNNPYAKYKSR